MGLDFGTKLDEVERASPEDRVGPLAELGRELLSAGDAGSRHRERLVRLLVEVVEGGAGAPTERVAAGEALGWLGDPRLRRPGDDDYWAQVDGVRIGRFPVTNAEFREWMERGGYERREHWSDAGWQWLQGCSDPWRAIASRPALTDDDRKYLVPNQPVIGVSWWEADAYARSQGARLPYSDERLAAVRGPNKRPYPWGEPFGTGNANTREEVIQRPCAVGLFVKDRTPEGVSDLAGNVAEWLGEELGGNRLVHPGAWNQPSMASWAKAKDLRPPEFRSAGTGFRLARD